MTLPFELQIGLRYTRAGKRRQGAGSGNGLISFVSLISVLGIGLGVAALITVLSVMNGFQKEVRDRMLGVLAHIEISAASGSIGDWQALANDARRNREVTGAAPYVTGQVLLTRGDTFRGALLRGVLPSAEPQVSDLDRDMILGHLTDLVPGEFGIVLGSELARSFGVGRGDKVTMVVPEGQVTPAGVMPRFRQFTVVGVFESGHYEYDSTLALVQIDDATKLFRQDGYTGVRLKLRDMQDAPEVAYALSRQLRGDYLVLDWTQQNRNWFAAVQTEKKMMAVILALIIMVAATNLVSSLVMTVRDKQSDIAILRTLGAAPGSITAIFVIQGALIGLLGCGAGVLLGVFLSLNIGSIVSGIENLFGVSFLPKDVYFINTMPSDMHLSDIVVIGCFSIVLSLVATLYPSWRAARVQPADALRYD
ncbi:MAG: lipoprotein-releasing ABC transporter permease subunit [Burkholderiaceae bacterium]